MNEFIPNFTEIRQVVNFQLITIILILVSASIMSACLSMAIAEKKSHNLMGHGITGALLPLFYPAFISVTLKSKGEVKTKAPEEEKNDKNDETDDNLPLLDLNADYFKSIYLDSEGNPTGPYLIDMESNVVKAESIVEVQAEFIIIQTVNDAGKPQRLRVPYSKITSCTPVDV